MARKKGVALGPTIGEEKGTSHDQPPGDTAKKEFPIVGIGASAGGLEAFEQFFTNMPPHAGMAFVLIQHLDPCHKSILSELIRRYTAMPVFEIEDGMEVKPNSVYVIPPNRYLGILAGKLLLMEPSGATGIRTPIDFFFRSLAEDRKERAICVVLSGTGSEGALGIRAIKGVGGMTMAQSPESAKYDGMPRNALLTGLVDFTLPPEKMPEKLVEYAKLARLVGTLTPDAPGPKAQGALDKVFMIIRRQTGHDFSLYKHSAISRRAERRMAVHRISRVEDYVTFLQETPEEVETLFKELLIGVTGFFRDPDAWVSLRERVMPGVIQEAGEDGVRIWVAGCATGEEAYSTAIIAAETMTELKKSPPVQIFATDIDADAVELARLGTYPESVGVDLSPERVDRFFSTQDSSLRVKKEIRDMVVFALQSVIRDPPFSKVDLVCCRNLLIYLGPELQKKVVPLFHYALRKGGVLFLGSSETLGEFADQFGAVDRKWKIYRRKDTDVSACPGFAFTKPSLTDQRIENPEHPAPKPQAPADFLKIAGEMLFEPYCPTGAIIDDKGEILFVHGRTGKYLEHVTGRFSGNIISMAREGIRQELASAVHKALHLKKDIRVDGLTVKTNGDMQRLNLVVKPIKPQPSLQRGCLVIFEDLGPDRPVDVPDAQEDDQGPTVLKLRRELSSTKEYLQTTIEELQTANEEMKSSNEELQSTNEELQSTNEELETSKEELQSVNEELTTVNVELQQKIDELSKISSDLNNLLSCTQIGTIFLDVNLRIQRFTPSVVGFVNLIRTDVGRPLSHIVSNIRYDGLVEDATEVLNSLIPKELEIQTKDDRWYTMRIHPYRTLENVIDGVVVTFSEITGLKALENHLRETRLAVEQSVEERNARLEESEVWLSALFRAVDEAAITTDPEGMVLDVNPKAETLFGYKKEDVVGLPWSVLCADPGRAVTPNWDSPDPEAPVVIEGKRKQGEIIPDLTESATLVRDRAGRPLGMVKVFKARAPE